MNNERVPALKFGKDHWSLLAYIETLCVDGKNGVGAIDHRRVRCNEVSHSPLKGVYDGRAWKPSYGTRLSGFFDYPERADSAKAAQAGYQLLTHDDWDCLDDLESAGYVEILSMVNGFVRLKPDGIRVSALLRKHKVEGGMYANFTLRDEAVVTA